MAPDGYDRGSSRRGVWSHWVPLAITVTVATAGLAAWVWSQRKDEDGDGALGHDGLDYDNADYGDHPGYGASTRDSRGSRRPPRSPLQQHDDATRRDASNPGWGSRVSDALRRTPSPQQFFDSTAKTVAAGVAATGAVMGKALASIREEDRAYVENPWSEEADAKRGRNSAHSDRRQKKVAIVVSADTKVSDLNDGSTHELASILSHIPRRKNASNLKLYILIYAPDLKESALDGATRNLPPPSLGSSYSNIGHDQAQTLGEEDRDPNIPSPSAAYDAVYNQALDLVDRDSTILPFTTAHGYIHILRHIQPEVLYLQESLGGENGSGIASLQTWMRHDIILVVGAESGSGGLADSEPEADNNGKPEQWWQRPERVGRGRGIVVVDALRVHDDWARRVQGQE